MAHQIQCMVCLQDWACGSSKNHPALKEFTSQRRDKTHSYFLQAVGRKGTICYLDQWKEIERQGPAIGDEGYLELGTRTHQKGCSGTQRATEVGCLYSEEQWVARWSGGRCEAGADLGLAEVE